MIPPLRAISATVQVARLAAGKGTPKVYAPNTPSPLAPLPQPLWLPGFGAIGGKLYVVSGNNGTSELNTLYIYKSLVTAGAPGKRTDGSSGDRIVRCSAGSFISTAAVRAGIGWSALHNSSCVIVEP